MSGMTVYVIVIAMFLLNPADRNGPDLIEVLSEGDNKPLHFKTLEKCYEYTHEHLNELVYFAMENFKPKPALVRAVACVEKELINI